MTNLFFHRSLEIALTENMLLCFCIDAGPIKFEVAKVGQPTAATNDICQLFPVIPACQYAVIFDSK
jgi:hypothetical protein